MFVKKCLTVLAIYGLLIPAGFAQRQKEVDGEIKFGPYITSDSADSNTTFSSGSVFDVSGKISLNLDNYSFLTGYNPDSLTLYKSLYQLPKLDIQPGPSILIEDCKACRMGKMLTGTQSELLSTFDVQPCLDIKVKDPNNKDNDKAYCNCVRKKVGTNHNLRPELYNIQKWDKQKREKENRRKIFSLYLQTMALGNSHKTFSTDPSAQAYLIVKKNDPQGNFDPDKMKCDSIQTRIDEIKSRGKCGKVISQFEKINQGMENSHVEVKHPTQMMESKMTPWQAKGGMPFGVLNTFFDPKGQSVAATTYTSTGEDIFGQQAKMQTPVAPMNLDASHVFSGILSEHSPVEEYSPQKIAQAAGIFILERLQNNPNFSEKNIEDEKLREIANKEFGSVIKKTQEKAREYLGFVKKLEAGKWEKQPLSKEDEEMYAKFAKDGKLSFHLTTLAIKGFDRKKQLVELTKYVKTRFDALKETNKNKQLEDQVTNPADLMLFAVSEIDGDLLNESMQTCANFVEGFEKVCEEVESKGNGDYVTKDEALEFLSNIPKGDVFKFADDNRTASEKKDDSDAKVNIFMQSSMACFVLFDRGTKQCESSEFLSENMAKHIEGTFIGGCKEKANGEIASTVYDALSPGAINANAGGIAGVAGPGLAVSESGKDFAAISSGGRSYRYSGSHRKRLEEVINNLSKSSSPLGGAGMGGTITQNRSHSVEEYARDAGKRSLADDLVKGLNGARNVSSASAYANNVLNAAMVAPIATSSKADLVKSKKNLEAKKSEQFANVSNQNLDKMMAKRFKEMEDKIASLQKSGVPEKDIVKDDQIRNLQEEIASMKREQAIREQQEKINRQIVSIEKQEKDQAEKQNQANSLKNFVSSGSIKSAGKNLQKVSEGNGSGSSIGGAKSANAGNFSATSGLSTGPVYDSSSFKGLGKSEVNNSNEGGELIFSLKEIGNSENWVASSLSDSEIIGKLQASHGPLYRVLDDGTVFKYELDDDNSLKVIKGVKEGAVALAKLKSKLKPKSEKIKRAPASEEEMSEEEYRKLVPQMKGTLDNLKSVSH